MQFGNQDENGDGLQVNGLSAELAGRFGIKTADSNPIGITNQYGLMWDTSKKADFVQSQQVVLPAFPPSRGNDVDAGELPVATIIGVGLTTD